MKEARVTQTGDLLFSASRGSNLLSLYGKADYDHGDGASCTLGSGLSGGCQELYVYRAQTHELTCASCNPTGAPATSDAADMVREHGGAASITWHLSHAFSDDGKRVFFNTAESLVPQDSNGKVDAYEYDAPTGTIHLISTGKGTADSYFLDASASGNDVFIATRDRLTGWDEDSNYDLYDARVDGGFPAPVVTVPGCAGDACQGSGSSAPAPATAGSESFANPRPATHAARHRSAPKRCRRGYVRKRVHGKVRCVKRKPARKSHRRTHARRKGGAR